MKFIKSIKTFLSLDLNTMLLLLEAFIYLGWARILLHVPFTTISPSLGFHMQETAYSTQPNQTVLKKISNAIGIVGNHTFWESKCLVKAIAGLKMLERRRIESTLYLGTAKDKTGELIAHAWLRSGSFYVTGAEAMKGFTVVGKFAKRISKK